MGLNVTGQEVATGVHDPTVMFGIVVGIFTVGILIIMIYAIYKLMS